MDNKDYELRCRSCGATYLLSNAQLHSCGDTFVEPSKLTLNDGIPAETERQRYDRLRERMYTDRTSHAFHDASRALDTLIMSTPTSPKREYLTEANIHLQVAIEALNKAMKA